MFNLDAENPSAINNPSPRKKARRKTFDFMEQQKTTAQHNKKRTRNDDPEQPIPSLKKPSSDFVIEKNELHELNDVYRQFLSAKKDAGAGLTSCTRSKQEDRQEKIEELDRLLAIMSDSQSFDDWTRLLVTLIIYHKALYTENYIPKTDSTFGDALLAVHKHILSRLRKIGAANTIGNSLTQRVYHYINGSTEITPDLLHHAALTAEEPAEKLIIFRAAFGFYEGLQHCYTRHPGLDARLDAFTKEIALRIQETKMGYACFYQKADSQIIQDLHQINPSLTK